MKSIKLYDGATIMLLFSFFIIAYNGTVADNIIGQQNEKLVSLGVEPISKYKKEQPVTYKVNVNGIDCIDFKGGDLPLTISSDLDTLSDCDKVIIINKE